MNRLRAAYVRWRWCRKGLHHDEALPSSPSGAMFEGRTLYHCMIPGCGRLMAR